MVSLIESVKSLVRLLATVLLLLATLGLSRQESHGQESAPPEAPPTGADIGFIGLHGGIYEQFQKYAPALNLRLVYFEDGEVSRRVADLGQVRVLYVQHLREEDRDAYQNLIQKAREKNPSLSIIVFQANSFEFLKSISPPGAVQQDAEAQKYYGSSSENLRRLLVYTAAKRLGRDLKIEPPEIVEREGFYHPDHPEFFPTAAAFETWRRGREGVPKDAPRLLIAVHSTHLAFQQPAVVDALIREAERQGAIAAAIIDGRSPQYAEQAVTFGPSAVIHTCHSGDPLPMRLKLNVPHLHSIFIRKQSIDQFQSSLEGLSSSELAFHIIGQELIGAIEPQVAGGTTQGAGSAEAFQPIPDRVEHLISRALSFASLNQTLVADKKIAVIYYDREMGKGELMRGSSTGMHLNAPRSLLNVLEAMSRRGYAVEPVPRHEDELLGWMMERGRQVGVWAPAELDRLVRNGDPDLVPEAQYRDWYQKKVPADRREQLEAKWGPAPGRFMVWENKAQKFIVIPRIALKNIILLPQPLRGELHGREDASSQTHDKLTSPPHNYLATYFWLEQEFGANAVIHFGTHGSEFALPGKPNGLARRDWCDVIMGRMPNFNPWIIENMVESSPVKRRVYGTLISHLPPPIVDAGLSDELANLHESVDKWTTLEEGALKQKFREDISRMTREAHLDADLKISGPPERLLESSEIEVVSKYLHDIQEETTPTSLHVYGERPRADLLIPYMVTVLRSPFLRELGRVLHDHQHEEGIDHDHEHDQAHAVRPAAEKILTLVVRQGVAPLDAVNLTLGTKLKELPEVLDKGLKLAVSLNADFDRTTDEVDNLLKGLDGRFVPPGPGNSPIRNPNAVPTGRNMYLLNPEEVPTPPSWELGRKLADELVTRHQAQTGDFPTKIGFDLRSSATFRDYGVMEAQILHLIGVEPIYDERNLVNDVRLVPRDKLGRPRVDVFIASGGWYESNLPSRLNLWDKAIRLAAAAEEPDNPLFKNTAMLKETLAKQGIEEQRAALLSRARIFGRAPGRESGGFIAYRVARSGDWETRDEIATAYLAESKNVFTEGAWGEPAAPLYDAAIQGTHTVVRSWSDHMTGPLASRYIWLHGGSLSLAVEAMTGKRPEYVFSDVRDPDKAGIVNAEVALRREFRVRLFNRKWLEGMMKEGYSGADHIRFLTSNSFGWEVMRPGSVGNANWDEMKRILIDDKLNLNLPEWMERSNPYAYQDSMATMLEAVRKGYWKADAVTIQDIAVAYAESVGRHGLSGHMTSGGNKHLDALVRGELAKGSSPGTTRLIAEYVRSIEAQTQLASAELVQANAPAPDGAPGGAAAPSASAATGPPAAGQSVAGGNPPPASPAPDPQPTAEPSASPDVPVEGQRLEAAEKTKEQGKAAQAPSNATWITTPLYLGVVVALLILIGFVFRRGAP